MARIRSITLTLSISPQCRILNRRSQSSSSSSSDPLIRKLEDAVQCIMVRRSAPDWLPFLPGASYWVPPQPSNALAQLLHHLATPSPNPISHLPAWPSSSYFIHGAAAPQPLDSDSHPPHQPDDQDEFY